MMHGLTGQIVAILCAVGCALAPAALAQDRPLPASESRAVDWLAKEVARWHGENRCYSCHHHGDAMRTLATAFKAGHRPAQAPLADSLAFLTAPAKWDANGPDGPFKDKKLARIQFAAALAEAHAAKWIDDARAVSAGAALVAELQTPDGCWETDLPGSVGSPATYGRALATAIALRTLAIADAQRYRASIERARNWFIDHPATGVLDSAATLWALADNTTPQVERTKAHAFTLVAQGESPAGGWGPFVNSPPEIFDTAVVVLALSAQQHQHAVQPLIARGRKYLVERQTADGSWPATTRPAGADSYAQQTSTTAWATLALLATSAPEKK